MTVPEFDLRQVSELCGGEKYKGRLLFSAGEKPYLSLRLKPGEDALRAARALVADYAAPLDRRLSKKPVIARRPNGPTWQSVSKTHEYQHIPDFLVTDSHVAALLGMTEKGLSTRWGADEDIRPYAGSRWTP